MDVRVLGICPVRNLYDDDGNYFGLEEMFWIYYPEARPVFAQSIVFNRSNSAEERTYDELFWKGMDALLEAERIKNELFEFEHELWEF